MPPHRTRTALLAPRERGAHLSTDHPPAPLAPGDRIADRYVVEEEVGHGGMATVYRARDTRHDATVALKFLRPELAAVIGAARFAREIRITAQLQHPGIVSVFDSGEHQGIPFYVMPFVVGESLAARLQREGVLGIEEAVRMTCDVARALAHAHAKGVVHRDVKPANILLSGPHVLLADFGVARAVSLSGTESITESGIAFGTAQYMSPEQAAGVSVDARADIYSLGCVLYEMLAGSPPFTGPPQVVVARHSLEQAPSLQAFRRGIPMGVAAAITKSMAKVPGDRHATVEAFAAALEAGLADPTAVAPIPRSVRTSRLLGGAALVGAIAAAIFFLARDRTPALDPHRVIVFPLVVPADFPGAKSAGEDAATIIGGALDGTEPLRWIDGWSVLTPEQRDAMRSVPLEDLLRIAAARGGGWAVTGRLLARGDSVTVALDLHDVRAGALAAEQSGVSAAGEPWRAALKAIGGLLPTLIPEGARQLSEDWFDRPPAAIASFLLGEAAFRRVQPGEAYTQFARALKSDSTFVGAALRGAQAASWRHRPSDASALLDRVASLPMPARHAAFVRGFRAYIAGEADSAIAAFNQAIELDPEMAEAWTQLGETYIHLLPSTGNPDSAASIALAEAARLDSGTNGPLLHLIELKTRAGSSDADALVARFLAGGPDTLLAAQVRAMQRCPARRGAEVDWSEEAARTPLALLLAANLLAGGGARLDCAESAYRALLRADTANNEAADNRRFYEILALQEVLIAADRADEAIVALDAFIARWGFGTSIFLLAAPYDSAFTPRARAVAAADADDADGTAPGYTNVSSDSRLWQLGVFESTLGSTQSAAAIARELRRRAEGASGRAAALLALSVEARLALAAGDTARAMEMLRTLVPAVAPGPTLQWETAASMAGERLLLARLLAARGEHARAIATADVLDSPWPVVHLLTLRESLRLRATSAEAIGARGASERYRARLAALDLSPTPARP